MSERGEGRTCLLRTCRDERGSSAVSRQYRKPGDEEPPEVGGHTHKPWSGRLDYDTLEHGSKFGKPLPGSKRMEGGFRAGREGFRTDANLVE